MNHAHTPEHLQASPPDVAVNRSIKVIDPADGETPACPPLRLVSLLTPQLVEVRRAEVIVGRHSNADLQLMQSDVSRHHCRIFFAGDQWQIGDLGSMNGIQVNNEKVQSAVLRENDVVGIATHLFRVVLDSDHPVEPASAGEEDRACQVLRDIADALPRGIQSTRKHSA